MIATKHPPRTESATAADLDRQRRAAVIAKANLDAANAWEEVRQFLDGDAEANWEMLERLGYMIDQAKSQFVDQMGKEQERRDRVEGRCCG